MEPVKLWGGFNPNMPCIAMKFISLPVECPDSPQPSEYKHSINKKIHHSSNFGMMPSPGCTRFCFYLQNHECSHKRRDAYTSMYLMRKLPPELVRYMRSF